MLGVLAIISCLGCELPKPVAMPVAGVAVDVELVLAVDVSRSMDLEEFTLQRAGYVAALRHSDFVEAVLSGLHGRVAITYFEWAGTVRAESVVPWQIIDGPQSAAAFAARLEARPFSGFRGTSISGAVTYGASLFDRNDADGFRRVIDISGDGPNNFGKPVIPARDAALAQGIVINGLPILIRPSRTASRLDRYYAECVTGGPGSFVLPIKAASEFATAIRRKLVLEVSGDTDALPVIRIDTEPRVDCMAGERDRRIYSDPYFPELDR
ncbi:uncharacterized protein DUF1194 [Aminobacter aminovorans]|uniref:Protein of uncharacterized function (DUF1194) n=1 Tax=Aminobacter aminovorans TaxID=83263 RepID=A0A380WJ84_AMIAI|nr:DUF1194 domain-containing protein [Aminobacter aminovorans]TCS26635.1 uncharacterized protein DUF1194 [Aminobacter aminovorans]SUU88306.1 Protein of uncharacterised function (DUF1194) [Aminobacter aminovorans]